MGWHVNADVGLFITRVHRAGLAVTTIGGSAGLAVERRVAALYASAKQGVVAGGVNFRVHADSHPIAEIAGAADAFVGTDGRGRNKTIARTRVGQAVAALGQVALAGRRATDRSRHLDLAGGRTTVARCNIAIVAGLAYVDHRISTDGHRQGRCAQQYDCRGHGHRQYQCYLPRNHHMFVTSLGGHRQSTLACFPHNKQFYRPASGKTRTVGPSGWKPRAQRPGATGG